MSHKAPPGGALSRAAARFEETAIAVLLGLMTLVTFVNVVLRYVFNTGFLWSVELTGFLFAWLVIFGVSHGVRVGAHLGVDALLVALPRGLRRLLGFTAAAVCLAYAFLLLKGAWDYWANFANLPQTTGSWFPLGFEEMRRTSFRGWYETEDIPMPGFLRFIEPWMNDGDAYGKLPRFIPYVILPVGAALLLLRLVQASLRLVRGQTETLIASHEAEDAVADAARGKEN